MDKKIKMFLSAILLTGTAITSFGKDVVTDVLVIGGGGAGLTAAVAAKEKGANVIVVEKMPILGGNTNYATGGLNASETDFQKAKGIKDTNEQFINDTMKGGKNKNLKHLVTLMADRSADIVKWLSDRGADLTDIGRMAGQSVDRTHRPKGGEPVGPNVIDALEAAAEKEKVNIKLNTKAVNIQDDGAEKLVTVDSPEGSYKIKAKAVILATGGFGANPKMIENYSPALKGFGTTNHPGATGEGIVMAEKLGAEVTDMNEIQTHPTVVPVRNYMITEAVRGNGAILVNREGKRFVNELETRDVVSEAELKQQGGTAFLIFDDGVRESLKAIDGYRKMKLLTEAETLPELAKKLDIPATQLEKTIVEYNKFVKEGKDSEFNRNSMPRTLEKGPFFAVEVGPAVHHTMGGVVVNGNTEILGTNGQPIPGLFAAGEVTGGIHGANRLGGNAMTDITVFGKIAGEEAAEYAKKVK